MKHTLKITLAVLTAMVILSSCEENEAIPIFADLPSNDTAAYFIDNSIYELEEVTTELSLEREMNMNFETPEMNFMPPVRPPRDGKFIPLAQIFRKMELTEEQMESVRNFMRMKHHCQWQIKRTMFESAKVYMDNVNQERRLILQQLKEGEITREEARRLIFQLNKNAREFMAPLRLRAMNAIKNCHMTFFDNIESILTEEQLVLWNRFKMSIRQRLG